MTWAARVIGCAGGTTASLAFRAMSSSPDIQTAASVIATARSMVDTAVKNAPAGTENAVTLVKSAVAAANNAFETVQKAAKQATDVAEANFQAMTSTAVKATQAQGRARRAA